MTGMPPEETLPQRISRHIPTMLSEIILGLLVASTLNHTCTAI
jgi:hypothetical protein